MRRGNAVVFRFINGRFSETACRHNATVGNRWHVMEFLNQLLHVIGAEWPAAGFHLKSNQC